MTATLHFKGNDSPTLGVELELQLVDARSMALESGITRILDTIGPVEEEWIKPELMQCYTEINTRICHTVAEVEEDLTRKLKILNEAAAANGMRLFWGGTHPFSAWSEQKITPIERYRLLVDKMQDTARRLLTFGMHVHVGVDTGDKAIMLVDRLLRYLPPLLSLSANSPFWCNRDTGLHSCRSKIMETLPVAGLPPLMRNWSEYLWVVNHSLETGFINTTREIWWDIRPHPIFGTVEVRVCDMPQTLEEVVGITAFIQCLVARLSENIDEGVYQHDTHPVMVKQNMWKACRYGLTSTLVDPTTHKPTKTRELIDKLLEFLLPTSDILNCRKQLEGVQQLTRKPNGAERQRQIYQKTGDMKRVVQTLVEENPVTG